jgi:hypothetical protein
MKGIVPEKNADAINARQVDIYDKIYVDKILDNENTNS